MLPALEVTPLPHCDDRRNDQSLIGQRLLQVTDLSASSGVFSVGDPQFDAVIARFADPLNFIRESYWLDGAGVQAIFH